MIFSPIVEAASPRVDSDDAENGNYHIEVEMYHDTDEDPNNDYYVVAIYLRDTYQYGNVWPYYQQVNIYAYTAGAVPLEMYMEPSVGVKFFGNALFSAYGVTISIPIPGGYVSVTRDDPWFSWFYDSLPWIAGIPLPESQRYVIAYRVPEGAGLSVTVYATGVWYSWWFIFLLRHHTGNSPSIYVSSS